MSNEHHEHEHRPLSPEERRALLELLRQTVRGERASAGRDEVPGPVRVEISAMHGRALACLASTREAGRALAPRTPIDVLGGAWLTIPPGWLVTRPASHVRITDPTNEAVLEISHQPYPLDPRLPSLRERLQVALSHVHAPSARIVELDRGDLELVWAEYEREATDTRTGARALARSRILIAANDARQALVTFSYWPADEAWAVPEWETILSTLRLAGHLPDLAADATVASPDRA